MKRRTKKFIISLVLTLACLLITTLIIQFPNPCFEYVGSKDAWISFFGSVTGGLLTITGVIWTLEAQEEQRRKDLAIQYKPLLSLIEAFSSGSKEKHDFTTLREIHYNASYTNNPSYAADNLKYKNYNYLGLIFSNIGRGQVENCYISKIEAEHHVFFRDDIWWSFSGSFADLMVEEKSAIKIYFPIYAPLYAQHIKSPFQFSMKLSINYTDEFGLNKYLYEIYINLLVSYTNTKFISNDMCQTPVVELGYKIDSIMPKLTKI